jgi:hypothetical protein
MSTCAYSVYSSRDGVSPGRDSVPSGRDQVSTRYFQMPARSDNMFLGTYYVSACGNAMSSRRDKVSSSAN